MKAFFEDILEYTYRSNTTMILLLERNEKKVSTKALNTASHLLIAQQLWNRRLEGKSNDLGLWDLLQVENMGEMNKELYQQTLGLLQQIPLSQVISYHDTKGDPYTNTFQEILFHLVNHSTYHRGQVIAQMKEDGIEVESTDYIYWKRK